MPGRLNHRGRRGPQPGIKPLPSREAMRSSVATALQDMKVTKRILVDVPAPIQLSGTQSVGSPSTAGPSLQQQVELGPAARGSSVGPVDSQMTLSLSSGAASPMNSSVSAQSLAMLDKSLVSSPLVLKPRPLAKGGSSNSLLGKSSKLSSTAGGPILGTTLYRVEDNQSTGTTFSLSTTARQTTSSSTTRGVTQLIDEDVNTPSFFFRNISILQLPETAELGVKVGDAEHVLRSQCVFLTAMLYEFIRGRVYEDTKQYVGILGCGRMGRLIVGSLLDLGWPADCLLVCSRDLDKLADLQAQGVVCTNKHAALSTVPLVFLCVSPINLREVKEQMTGVLRPETLLVSLLAGVTGEKLTTVFKHDLLLRTIADLRCFPAPWSKHHMRRAANDFLGFEVRTYNDYLDQAAKHMVAAPGYVDSLLARLRLLAQRLEWDEEPVEALMQALLFGKSLSSISEGDEDPEDASETGTGGGPVDLADLNDVRSRYSSYTSTYGHNNRTPSTGMTTRAGSSGILKRRQHGLLYSSSSSSSFGSSHTPRAASGSVKSLNKEVGFHDRQGRGAAGKAGGRRRGAAAFRGPFAEHPKFEKLEQSVSSLVIPVFQRNFSEWAKEQQRLQKLQQDAQAAAAPPPAANKARESLMGSIRGASFSSSLKMRERNAEGVLATLGASYRGDALMNSTRTGGWASSLRRLEQQGDDKVDKEDEGEEREHDGFGETGTMREGTLRDTSRGATVEIQESKPPRPTSLSGTSRRLAGFGSTARKLTHSSTGGNLQGEESATPGHSP